MNKKVIIFTGFLMISQLLFSPAVLFAGDGAEFGLDDAAAEADLPTAIAGGKTSLIDVLSVAVSAGLTLIGILFFLLILYAGANWMIARGDSARVDSAKDTLERATVGLLIVVGSYAVSRFVFELLLRN